MPPERKARVADEEEAPPPPVVKGERVPLPASPPVSLPTRVLFTKGLHRDYPATLRSVDGDGQARVEFDDGEWKLMSYKTVKGIAVEVVSSGCGSGGGSEGGGDPSLDTGVVECSSGSARSGGGINGDGASKGTADAQSTVDAHVGVGDAAECSSGGDAHAAAFEAEKARVLAGIKRAHLTTEDLVSLHARVSEAVAAGETVA